MQRRQIGRLAGITLALMICSWAQSGDTPIVILDGSLTMESAVPWNQFTGTGDLRSHPHAGKAVTKVTITMPGTNQTVTFNNEQCTVDVTYASTDIKVTTGNNGRGLRITPFSAFQNGDTPNRLAHKNQNAKISHVTVTKAGVTAFDSAASGGTKIVISYQ
jgi:hypothetical protein